MTDDPNRPLSKAELDLDRIIKLYERDGNFVIATPRDLMTRGNMTLQDVIAVERFGEAHYKPIHDALVSARKAGLSEAKIQQIFDAHKDADGQ